MLFRMDNERFIVNAQEFPANMVVMALQSGPSTGGLTIGDQVGQDCRPLAPTRSLMIFPRMVLNEYVIPAGEFRNGFRGGVFINVESSYRCRTEYLLRRLTLLMQFPPNGGGVVRIIQNGVEWDIGNPTFNPKEEIPPINDEYNSDIADVVSGPPGIANKRVPDDVLIRAYQRVHTGWESLMDAARKKQGRLANFNLDESVAELEETSLTVGVRDRHPPRTLQTRGPVVEVVPPQEAHTLPPTRFDRNEEG